MQGCCWGALPPLCSSEACPPPPDPLRLAPPAAAFGAVNRGAAALFAPTLVWVTIAAKLNWDIVRLNPGAEKEG